jgi:ABC-type multidrug transport system ATPase subunit
LNIENSSAVKLADEQPPTTTRKLAPNQKTATHEGIKPGEAPVLSMLSMGSGSMSTVASRIPVELVWKEVNIVTKSKKNFRQILHHVSGIVKPGQFLAIIGASGASKTTLLNCLNVKMLAHDLKSEGEILINGKNTKDSKNYLEFTAFVQQEDVLMETLTCQECLEYAAMLKFSADPEKQKQRLEELELNDIKDLRFGGLYMKGRTLNRGERKRLSIAVELITNPSLLFLDEPTTSMDAFTTEKIIKIMHKLKFKGRTIVATIHQPNTHIYNSFDQLIIMSLGKIIYHNVAKDAVSYFGSIGYHCPVTKNPADYFMSLLSSDTFASIGHTDKTYPEFIEDLSMKCAEGPKFTRVECDPSMPELTDDFVHQRKYKAKWFIQFLILLHRSVRNCARLFLDEITRAVALIILGLFMISLYYGIGNRDIVGFMDRVGVVFMLASTMAMGALNHYILSFPEERAVLVREQVSSLYDVSAYFFAKVIGEIPFSLHTPLVLVLLLQWTVPLAKTVGAFFIQYAAMLISYQSGAAYALLTGAFITDRESLINMPLIMLSGFFVNLDNVLPILWPFQWISSLKYTFNIMLRTEFERNNELDYYFEEGGKEISMTTDQLLDMAGIDLKLSTSFIYLVAPMLDS